MKKYIDIKTALYYMNYKSLEVSETLLALLEEGRELLAQVLTPRFCMKESDINNSLLEGEDIKNHLDGCEKVLFFAATLGAGTDKLISKTELTNPSLAFCLDALADTAIENYCDEIENGVKLPHTSRFSPGYGDLPLSIQPQFLKFLDTNKKIGLSCTDTYILTPRKSVTAIIGG
ncbi:hypothetical protein FACS1894132_12740 [Clostridia bacterium]|nr:hypothetical protein FACS1894132_12740 [Clostridia bacterium]